MLQKSLPYRELISIISSKGQVTVPAQIRRHLGVNTNDKIAFVVEASGAVRVTPAKYPDINSLAGVAGSLNQPMSWKEVKKVAREDRLEKKYGK